MWPKQNISKYKKIDALEIVEKESTRNTYNLAEASVNGIFYCLFIWLQPTHIRSPSK